MDFYPPLNLKDVFLQRSESKTLNRNASFNSNNLTKQRKDLFQLYNLKDQLRNSSENMRRYGNILPNFKNAPYQQDERIQFDRKLGSLEKVFHGQTAKNRCYIYRTILVSSDIDFYKNLTVVKDAITEWKNRNPLLRAMIKKKQNEYNLYNNG